MAGFTFGKSGSSGGFSFGGGGGSAPSAPSKPHGILGFISNLGGDIKNAALGFPTGIVSLVTHPIRGAELIGKATWHDWSPLFHGHFGQFAHQSFDHPLAPILDVMSVFGGAGALAGKLGDVALAG